MNQNEDQIARASRIEARSAEYIHRARRLLLEMFGNESATNRSAATVELANAMMMLEAAELMANATREIARSIDKKEI